MNIYCMRITRNGQITLPKSLRDRLGITMETDLEFRVESDELILAKPAPESAVQAIRGSVKRLPFGRDVDE